MLLVVIIGGVIGFILLKKGGSNGPTLTTYTSSDNTFSVGYPTGWQTKQPPTDVGNGIEFVGTAGQMVIVAHVGSAGDVGSEATALFDAGFCNGNGQGGGFGGAPTSPQAVSIGGQNWTQEECDNSTGDKHAAVESVVYKGEFYFIAYESSKANFASDRSQYFGAIEQSFKFLS